MTQLHGEDELQELLGEPAALVRAKVSDRLNELTRQFVDRSPFVLLATSAPDGTCDVSPRGDPPGLGASRAERRRGQGAAPRSPDRDRPGFTHCSKAFLRSRLWDPETFVARSELPSSGEIHRSLNPDFDAETYDAERASRYERREGFY